MRIQLWQRRPGHRRLRVLSCNVRFRRKEMLGSLGVMPGSSLNVMVQR